MNAATQIAKMPRKAKASVKVSPSTAAEHP